MDKRSAYPRVAEQDGDRSWQFGVLNNIISEPGLKAMHREVAL
jgi:hypothetical protein